jgi:hypothetical protein
MDVRFQVLLYGSRVTYYELEVFSKSKPHSREHALKGMFSVIDAIKV